MDEGQCRTTLNGRQRRTEDDGKWMKHLADEGVSIGQERTEDGVKRIKTIRSNGGKTNVKTLEVAV